LEAYQLLTTDLLTPADMGRWFPELTSPDAGAELARMLPANPLAGHGRALMEADRRMILAWDLLPKMDIATMGNSVEARSPLLDTELVSFARSLPASVVIGRGGTKPLLRALARRYLPPAVVTAPKRGFEVPVDRWLAGPLRPLLEDTLLAADSHVQTFASGRVQDLVSGRAGFSGNRAQLTWALLMLELFLRDQ
jgi:asparagine synthase (glutamine-hydrolysing)